MGVVLVPFRVLWVLWLLDCLWVAAAGSEPPEVLLLELNLVPLELVVLVAVGGSGSAV
jgi:hypothetical protein